MGHHHHHHHHHHSSGRARLQLVISAILLLDALALEKLFPSMSVPLLLIIYMVPYLAAGFDTLHSALAALLRGDALEENFLMSIATLGSFAIAFLPGGDVHFVEAVAVMLLYKLGVILEENAEAKTRHSIESMTEIRPDYANLAMGEHYVTVHPSQLKIDDEILIRPGEKVPVDGIVTDGVSNLDMKALSGESMAKQVGKGDEILSASINLNAVLRVKVSRVFEESTASKILKLVEDASEHKSRSENFITRFARIYTPVVVALAVLLAVVPPAFSAYSNFSLWLYRALTFLIASCPCALVISIPLAFFGGLGGASRSGILVKGSNYLEALAGCRTMVFDKTGTLTRGVFRLSSVNAEGLSEAGLLRIAANVERHSSHPIALSIREAYPSCNDMELSAFEEVAGYGVKAVTAEGTHILAGNADMMLASGLKVDESGDNSATRVYVAEDGKYLGCLEISDSLKEDAADAVRGLKDLGVKRLIMLTGDSEGAARPVAESLGLDEFHASLLPQDKLQILESILSSEAEGGAVAFVGDGINDAAALSLSDVGIAMGGLGSDAAIEASDVVLMDDRPSRICTAIFTARKTLSIAKQNTVFAIGVKALVLLLSAVGLSNMWFAVFADVGVTFLAVLNSMRTLRS